MNLIDIREPNGPYWDAYQEERQREHILDDPGYVPDWFVRKLAHERIAAARVELEKVGENSRHHKELFNALRQVEIFLLDTNTADPVCAAVVWGLLGGQEIETARDFATEG